MNKSKVLVIVGPTGSGKSALAVRLAKKFNGEVISVDSRQVYRGLDIGTEKITAEEMSGIPHHLIDCAEPNVVYTAADFAKDAARLIDDITNRDRLPILAGGTFFYLDALFEGLPAEDVPPNPELRAELEKVDNEALFAALTRLDPTRADGIDKHNKRRLIRALEIVEAKGVVPTRPSTASAYEPLWIGLLIDKKELRARLTARAENALTRGLIEETKDLLKAGLSADRLHEIGLEYRVVLDYLDGQLEFDSLSGILATKNWQYAKRQLTWLKRNPDIVWFQPEYAERIENQVADFVNIALDS